MASLSLKEASSADLDDLIFLGRQTFIETYKGMGASTRPEGLEEVYGRETFNRDKLIPQLEARTESNSIYVIGFVDTVPAGFMKLEKGTPPQCVPEKNALQLSQLYVLKDHKGRGLGKLLLDQAKTKCMELGFNNLWLGVWDMNLPAIDFYKKAGFSIVGTTAWKFKHGEFDYEDTDFVMCLKLK